MFFHFQILFQSFLFLLLLEVVSTESVNAFLASLLTSSPLIAIITFIAVVGFVYKASYRISKKAVMTPIPVLFFLGSLCLSYFINSAFQLQLFILLSCGIYYAALLGVYRLRSCAKDQTARGIMGATALATIFFFNAAVYGIYLNFVVPLWALMMVFFFVTSFVSFQYLWTIKEDKIKVWNYSLILGLIMTEIAWVVNFWPFGYMTTGVVTLIFYYIFWDMVQCYFLDSLTKKKMIGNMIMLLILCGVVLLSSPWLPVV